MTWIIENIASVCVLLAVVLLVFFLVLYLVKSKKHSKGCGGACAGCAMAGSCHKFRQEPTTDTEKTDG